MQRVRINEVDSSEEVCKALNKIIDKLNENDLANADIDVFNAEVNEFNEKTAKGE